MLSIAFLSNASSASAFWPFYSNAQAQTEGIIPSSSTPTLSAPTNVDPTPPGPSLLATTGDTALVANQGPDGIPSGDSIFTPASAQISSYIVKPGDTLSEIAAAKGVSVNTIIWANNLGSSKSIHPGQTLVILPVTGVEHTIVKGDTLATLSKKYGGAPSDIANANGLDSSAPLVLGSVVVIPNGEIKGSAVVSASGGKNIARSPANPYRGGSGPEIDSYYDNPVPGAMLSQGLHGENAVDLAISRGTQIHAAAAGTVIVSVGNGAWNGGYGSYVVIAHGNGTETLYAHMSRDIVKVGDTVSQDQIIGYVGTTGDATGPHVHFEVRGARNPFADCSVGAVCQPE